MSTCEKGDSGTDRRRDDRLPVRGAGRIILIVNQEDAESEHEETFSCHIADVALAGVRVVSTAPVEVGEEVILSIPEIGEFAGRVQWKRAREFGLSLQGGPDLFLKRIAEDERFAHLKPVSS